VNVYFTCLDCTLIGDTDKGAETHTRKTSHTTITGIDPEVLARVRASTQDLAAARSALAACREVAAKRAGR
jgi:hypothetical protein